MTAAVTSTLIPGGFVGLCTEISKPNEYPEIGRNKDGKWRYLTGRQVVHGAYCT